MTPISNHISAGPNAFTVQSHAFHRRAPSIHDPHQTVKGCAEKRSHFRTVINAAHSAFSACHNFLMLHNDGPESTQETYYCNHTCLESASERQVTDKCALTLIALALMQNFSYDMQCTQCEKIKALWISQCHILIIKSSVYGE